MSRLRLACALLVSSHAAGALAAAPVLLGSLADMTLEQLANVVVTTVSGRAQPLSQAAASIYVISAQDIRRSGATSLPEALRLAPNLQVARVDANQYAISARGFNNVLANKLLVLIDGRTVYSPLFSGVFWEAQDVMLEDIERIEVISGPGATIWGANAVNGVINVVTRSAAETQGTLVTAGTGTNDRQVAARYGGALDDGHFRIYAKAVRRDPTDLPNGTAVRDQADMRQAGFRSDWARSRDRLTLQGDFYNGETDQVPGARDYNGYNVLARWTRALDEGAEFRLQAYLDSTYRNQPLGASTFTDKLTTYDVEAQHSLARAGRHRLLWGFGVRQYRDRVENPSTFAFVPADRNSARSHVFAQDEVSLRENLVLTLGAKLDRNSYTGTEFLPTARLAWQVAPAHLLWTALSRTVRAPSRIDRDFYIPPNAPFLLAGGPQFASEVAKVAELGYRGQPTPRLSYSLTGFVHYYDSLRTVSPEPGGSVVANDLEGRAYGFETWASWRALAWARFDAGYTHLHESFTLDEGAVNLESPASQHNDPPEWWKLRAAFDLAPRTELDFMVRHYGAIDTRTIPAYTAVDARLGWHAARGLEVSLLLQNLFDPGHVEWSPGAQWDRAAYVQVRISL